MPYLVRWQNNGSEVTIRCEQIVASPLLVGSLRLIGVRGVSDPEHPSLGIHTMDVRDGDVLFITEAIEENAQSAVAPIAQTQVQPEEQKDTEPSKQVTNGADKNAQWGESPTRKRSLATKPVC